MKQGRAQRPRVLMICSRPIDAAAGSGREKTLQLIHSALSEGGEVEVEVMMSVLQRRRVGVAVRIVLRWAAGLLSRRTWPLQSLLFWDRAEVDRLARKIGDRKPNTIYFDGVRTGIYLPLLRKRFPELRMVCDFDDLMSQRMSNLAQAQLPISLGYMARFVPNWIARYLIQPLASSTIPRYEARALHRLEQEILSHAQACVLVSSTETDHLRALTPPAVRDRVHTIAPSIPVDNDALPLERIDRFVFIGSDGLLQNRRTIEHLVALWARTRPALELHLYGRQSGPWAGTAGIVVHGFVNDVAEAYTPGSVMMAPSFISGGVKTKVLEAFGYGIPVVGTTTTFEGIAADTAGLVLDDGELASLLRHPETFAAQLASLARTAITQARCSHATSHLKALWRNVVWPSGKT